MAIWADLTGFAGDGGSGYGGHLCCFDAARNFVAEPGVTQSSNTIGPPKYRRINFVRSSPCIHALPLKILVVARGLIRLGLKIEE